MRMLWWVFLISLLILSACVLEDGSKDSPTESPYISFKEVSQPYLDIYGTPEDISEYSGDFPLGTVRLIVWWWWTQGFVVEFMNTPYSEPADNTPYYDDVNGWAVYFEQSFDPIP